MAGDDLQDLRNDLAAALRDDVSAAALDAVVAKHFPDLGVFRENDDLIVVGGETRRLLIRRAGPDRFRISENAAASGSTNLLDVGGGAERDVDGLVAELADFAQL